MDTDLLLTPPDSRGDHGVSESHCCRLEDVSNLRVDSRVIPSAGKTVTLCHFIVSEVAIGELSRDKEREPFSVHNVLVSSNSQLASTVVKPLILFINTMFSVRQCFAILIQLSGPIIVHSEPEDAHG